MGLTNAEGSAGFTGLAPLASAVLDISFPDDAEEEITHVQVVSRIQETIQVRSIHLPCVKLVRSI
jgi:hypothetical protein